MRKIPILFVAIFFLAITLYINVSMGEPAKENNFVVAYYFHGNYRCHTCYTIEQYSKESIEANFKDALASGKLQFKVVNMEERGNEHYVKDYQLYTKSLILSLVKDGKEVKSKNLTKIWEYVRNRQRFYDYVRDEIVAFLKET